MALLLHIESATPVCSVALSSDGKLILEKTIEQPREHARLLTVAIDDLMKETGYIYSQLDGVAVSKGPGSYTGLRIGVAAAKGLCYALEIPLISTDTLHGMTVCASAQWKGKYDTKAENLLFIPMIDARRMEVYTAVFDSRLQMLKPVEAVILAPGTFEEFRKHELVFFGDGAFKYKELIDSELNYHFFDDYRLDASGSVPSATEKYSSSRFEDVAYFEPFYLKDFIAGPAR